MLWPATRLASSLTVSALSARRSRPALIVTALRSIATGPPSSTSWLASRLTLPPPRVAVLPSSEWLSMLPFAASRAIVAVPASTRVPPSSTMLPAFMLTGTSWLMNCPVAPSVSVPSTLTVEGAAMSMRPLSSAPPLPATRSRRPLPGSIRLPVSVTMRSPDKATGPALGASDPRLLSASVPPVAMSMPVVLVTAPSTVMPAPPCKRASVPASTARATSGWLALRMKVPVPELKNSQPSGSSSGVSSRRVSRPMSR